MLVLTATQKAVRQIMKKQTGIEKSLTIQTVQGNTSTSHQLLAADYVEFADKGRKKGKQPPIAAILDYMRRNGISGGNDTAFAISRSIGRRGTKGNHFISPMILAFEKELINDPLTAQDLIQIDNLLNNI